MSSGDDNSELLSVGFNQDSGCFACGTSTGFRIFNCDPFKETFRREFQDGGIGIVEMLFRCNILALVGGGQNPKYPPNKVMIWDDHQNRCIGELSFRSQVRAVRLRRDKIVVVLEHKIYVYNFTDLKLLHQIETITNGKGLCALSPTTNSTVLACPGMHKGQVRVELYDMKRTKFINAHDRSLACIALTLDGSRLATASEKGTIVRVYSATDGAPLHEFRRGTNEAVIFSIAFAPAVDWLAISSSKGTIHVYSLRGGVGEGGEGGAQGQGQGGTGSGGGWPTPGVGAGGGAGGAGAGSGGSGMPPAPANSNSFFKPPALLQGILPKYFNSEWSFAQVHLGRALQEGAAAIVAFGSEPNSLVVVGSGGSFHRAIFDPVKGGEGEQVACCNFLKEGAGSA